ncbi:Cleavage stimulation factor subunit 1 [Sarcoptes scabiei]|uniref:Cleavage stimulation factor 50 kDa subunit n=1 Tax=Sarcoptes scabiei TaxID=52283 RepID=A0A131ZZR5_SARSC|nr:Cleavage stimulation factor subunit 1 [Sarcoptes scabiei]KPM04173.1 cleavage stimulation factor subunit 1-like protein [Sarcoptes scabiei]
MSTEDTSMNNSIHPFGEQSSNLHPKSKKNSYHSGFMQDFRLRDQLYRLIISQFFYDGQAQLAKNVANVLGVQSMCPPSDRLSNLVAQALVSEDSESHKRIEESLSSPFTENGIDLDFETERDRSSAPISPSFYETIYVTSHKGPCRAGCFNSNGSLIATGSVDASIKILDVERMVAKTMNSNHSDASSQSQSTEPNSHNQFETHPVIRTLYDHLEEVSCLTFHPKDQFLFSGSHDMTIKVFDYSKPPVKRACKSIQDSHIIRCLALHSTGDYLLVGTQHPTIRLYHLPTFQSFISPVIADQHKGPITSIEYSPNSKVYVSSSKDGDIRLWDTVSNRCVGILPRAHDGLEICSVCFTKNGKYILSSGKDSMVKLWELSMSRCLIAYTGMNQNSQKHRTQSSFNHTEDFVLMPDEISNSLCVWDARNAECLPLLPLGHNQPVRRICHSPTAPAFLTCSDDFRARFWFSKSI